MNKLDPANLWEEKGPEYHAAHAEVLARVAEWLVEEYRPLWDSDTFHKTNWHLSRDSGLKAFCLQAARHRLSPTYRDFYTIEDFREFHLSEEVAQEKRMAIADDFWALFLDFKRHKEGISFYEKVSKWTKLIGWTPEVSQCLFCFLWDRSHVPLEFWTYPSMLQFLQYFYARKGAPGTFSEEQLRQWVQRFGLKKASPVIVSAFHKGVITKFDAKAAQRHRLPPGTATMMGYHGKAAEMKRKFEEDFRANNQPDQVISVYQNSDGVWICYTDMDRSWRWDD